ncbi:MAG: helix-turn-helix domain-containing protein [Leptospirales bacterium]|nr:helix-turn-helix domain-containing protein [Leptospirales bacterium]
MKLKPVKTKKDYESALRRIDALMDAAKQSDIDELEILATLVEDYEEKHFPIESPDPVEAIRFRLEQMGLTQSDLAEYVGGKSRASEIMNHKRDLSKAMIRTLSKALQIPVESLLGV